ncbi:MAG: hypothetical protein QOH41_3447 [Blastocatellia bacterium]|jgi:hypothetical protein|nr:hypothetical protein [Blastocatellia bacterium]
MNHTGWKKWIAVVAFALVVLATGVFAVRTVRRAMYWRMHRDETIRPWMSIPYVAHSYRVPPPVLYQTLKIPPQLHDRRTLKQIAHAQNRSVEEVISVLQDAIGRERADHPPGAPTTAPVRSP